MFSLKADLMVETCTYIDKSTRGYSDSILSYHRFSLISSSSHNDSTYSYLTFSVLNNKVNFFEKILGTVIIGSYEWSTVYIQSIKYHILNHKILGTVHVTYVNNLPCL